VLRLDHYLALLPIRNRQSAIRHQGPVDIIAAEPRIPIRREHLKYALVQFEDRDIERAPPRSKTARRARSRNLSRP